MKTAALKIRALLLLLGIILIPISLHTQDLHLELVDIIYETAPGSRPVTSFKADGNGGDLVFTIQKRSEGNKKMKAIWRFSRDLSLINIEGNRIYRVPSFETIYLITDAMDGGTIWEVDDRKKAKPPIQVSTSGKPPKILKKNSKYDKSLVPFWRNKGTVEYTQMKKKTKESGDIRSSLTGPFRSVRPGEYTNFTLHISTSGDPEIIEGFAVDIVYIFRINRGLAKVPKG